jgi:hypothetical protein
MDRLLRIEKWLRNLIEEALGGILQTRSQSQLIARSLFDAMQSGVELIDDGRILAPDRMILYLHPADARRLREKSPDLPDRLLDGIRDDVRMRGFLFIHPPTVTLIEDRNLPENGVRVEASISPQDLDETEEMIGPPGPQTGSPPAGAFIIVDGKRHVVLSKAAITVGRRQDNDLILDDPRVSRIHAQLRVKDGKFTLFDLGSSQGTRVNNRKVTQHILQAGDVIRVGSTRLVYGEDPPDSADETPTYKPARERGGGFNDSEPHQDSGASRRTV